MQGIRDITGVEPVQPQDKVMVGMLASLGIERGKPFNPQGKIKAAMKRGVADAYFYMHDLDTKLFDSIIRSGRLGHISAKISLGC